MENSDYDKKQRAKAARRVARSKQHGRAGSHSSRKGDRGYSRRSKHPNQTSSEVEQEIEDLEIRKNSLLRER